MKGLCSTPSATINSCFIDKKSKHMKKKNIKPGTPEWFKLWFAQTHLTGENPY